MLCLCACSPDRTRVNSEEDWRHANLNFSQSRTRQNGQLMPEEYTETGYVSHVFTIGPAVLSDSFLVFAAPARSASELSGNAHCCSNGFSIPYLVAMALATTQCTVFWGLCSRSRLHKNI